MRFKTSDLLWITTGAAVYAAMLGAYASRGGLTLGEYVPVGFWGAIAMIYIAEALTARRAMGERYLVVRRVYATRGHVGLLLICGVFPLLVSSLSTQQYEATTLFQVGFFHAALEAGGSMIFAERGVFVGRLRRWDAFRFELRPDTAKLICRYEPNRGRLAPVVCRVPRDRIEEIRAVLKEHGRREERIEGQA